MTEPNCTRIAHKAPPANPHVAAHGQPTAGQEGDMNTQKPASPLEDRTNEADIPYHPFFQTAQNRPNFSDCIDAIDRAAAVIELSNYLKLDEEEGGLPQKAAFGYYWVTEMTRSALAYTGQRLIELNRQQGEAGQKASSCLSSLCHAMPVLSRENRERFLNHAALNMDLPRREIDRYIDKITATHQLQAKGS
jgi:hypothetical protein